MRESGMARVQGLKKIPRSRKTDKPKHHQQPSEKERERKRVRERERERAERGGEGRQIKLKRGSV